MTRGITEQRVDADMEGGEVGAEDEAVMAEAGGGEEEGGGGDVVKEAGLQMPIPEAMKGQRPRRRPPREQWLLRQDAVPEQQAAAQPQAQHLTVPRHKTKPPDFLGIEQDRSDNATQQLDLAADLVNLPQDFTERMLSPSALVPERYSPVLRPRNSPVDPHHLLASVSPSLADEAVSAG